MANDTEADRPDPSWEHTFSTEMARLRNERGLTQYALARDLGDLGLKFQQLQIDRIERGERPVRLNEAVLIAQFFGRSLQQMIGEPDEQSTLAAHRRALERTVKSVPGYSAELVKLTRGVEAGVSAVSTIEEWIARTLQSGGEDVAEIDAAARATGRMLGTIHGALADCLRASNRATQQAERESSLVDDWIGIR